MTKISDMYETTNRVGVYMCDFCHEKPRKRKYKINKSNCTSLMFCSKKCYDAYCKKNNKYLPKKLLNKK